MVRVGAFLLRLKMLGPPVPLGLFQFEESTLVVLRCAHVFMVATIASKTATERVDNRLYAS